jgi:hypothetical protein
MGTMPSGAGRLSRRQIISLKSSTRSGQKKSPTPCYGSRAYTWRRPTLTGPIVPLPLALQRFTSGFGMGPGGSTALWSPEGNPVGRHCCLPDQDWGSGGLSLDRLPADSSSACNRFIEPPLSDIHTEKTSFSFMIDSLGASYELLFLAISLLAMTSKESSRTDD